MMDLLDDEKDQRVFIICFAWCLVEMKGSFFRFAVVLDLDCIVIVVVGQGLKQIIHMILPYELP